MKTTQYGEANRPKPMTKLTPEGSKVWKSVCDDLDKLGTLEATDSKLIDVYVRDYLLSKRVREQLANESLTLDSGNGRAFINPLVNAHNTLTTKLSQTLKALGLTPTTRKSMRATTLDDSPYAGMNDGIV